MKKYVSQLLQDIANAHRKNSLDPSESTISETSLEEYFYEVEAYLEHQFEEGPPFSEHCGLELDSFPTKESLSDIEKEALIDAMNKMLYSWHIVIDIPREAPLDLHYELTIQILDQPIFIAFGGNVTWDYCESDIPTCAYGEHCHCIEWEKEYEREVNQALSWLQTVETKLFHLKTNNRKFILEKSERVINSKDNIATLIGLSDSEVPFYVTHHVEELDRLCEDLLLIFPGDEDLTEVFHSDDLFGKMEALQIFLDLGAKLQDKKKFIVEPYYADDTRLKPGEKPQYTPEEFLEKLEHQFEIQDLAYDDDMDYGMSDEDEDEWPF